MRPLLCTFWTLSALLVVITMLGIPAVAGERLEYPAEKISFSELPPGWRVLDPTKFNFFRANRKSSEAMLFVRAAAIKSDDTKTLDERTTKWLDFIQKKYEWRNLEILQTGWADIGGEKAYWLLEEHAAKGGTLIRHKAYALDCNGNAYLIRLMSKAENFETAVGEFEKWVQTIRFIQ